MSTFKKILLVYDGTPEARSALERCSRLASALSVPVDVVSIVDAGGLNATAGGQLSGEAVSLLETVAQGSVDDAARQLRHRGVLAHGRVVFGPPVDTLAKHALALGSDIVVIGHRGHRRLLRWWAARPLHAELAEQLKGLTIVTVT